VSAAIWICPLAAHEEGIMVITGRNRIRRSKHHQATPNADSVAVNHRYAGIKRRVQNTQFWLTWSHVVPSSRQMRTLIRAD
jgi:hypothetical protein